MKYYALLQASATIYSPGIVALNQEIHDKMMEQIIKYLLDSTVMCNGISGKVIANSKLGEILIEWETGFTASYSLNWLEKNITLIPK